MMNFNAVNVFSICHPLFYIASIFIACWFLQRCFPNHVDCGITFTTISLSFLATYLCVNLSFLVFFEILKCKSEFELAAGTLQFTKQLAK